MDLLQRTHPGAWHLDPAHAHMSSARSLGRLEAVLELLAGEDAGY